MIVVAFRFLIIPPMPDLHRVFVTCLNNIVYIINKTCVIKKIFILCRKPLTIINSRGFNVYIKM